jgi:hypothetical protein
MMIHLFAQDMTREGKIHPCYLLMTRELTLKWMDLLPAAQVCITASLLT